ncbi:conjugal transfer protein [Shouchella miscanthi]|uniref:Conjugal transfer protein n=1 Tax=Shouchella miscanthi TaxID=2598861 RepID=A0ABU6NJ51_9BACI|nr:conjugal transfer protein [Shouchella miscanthi]
MKETYNYKKVFAYPITIYKFTDYFTLPYGVPLARLILAVVILIGMLMFSDFFTAIGSTIPGLTIVLYLGIPFFLSGYLMKQRYNGKRIHYFMYDFLVYFFTFYLPKKKLANDEPVIYLDEEKIEFDSTFIERKGGQNEAENTNQNRTRQLDVDKVG